MTTTAMARTNTLPITLAILTDAFLALANKLADIDPGHDDEKAMVIAQINDLAVEWKDKAIAVAAIAREFKVLGERRKEEAARIAAFGANDTGTYEGLREYLHQEMRAIPVMRVEGDYLKVRRQANSVASMVIDNEAEIPDGFWKMVRTLDEPALRSALEAGEVIPGAHLEKGEHIRIW